MAASPAPPGSGAGAIPRGTAPRTPARITLAVAALGGGGLAYEIALTRLTSALLVSDWVGPVLAAALLGSGLGAAAAATRPAWRTPGAAATAAALAPLLAAAAVPALLAATRAGAPLLGLALPVAAYGAIGLAVAATFAHHRAASARLYRADLAAAALAAAATPLVLGRLGGLHGSLAAAALLSVAALALAGRGRRRTAWFGAAAAWGIAAAAIAGLIDLDPRAHAAAKPIRAVLERGGVVEASRWDAVARTDLVRTPDGARYLFMDGGAGSLVPDPDTSRWWHDVGAFAFAAAPVERAFLIGSGGGLDVAQARAHGVREVIAVEVNRASVDLVRRLGARAGGVYDAPTEVRIGDGRRELARVDGRFDAITLANVVTQAAELRGAALTENRVYTLEAFRAYLGRLTPGGHLALTLYDEATLTRALTTALEALVTGGWAADHAAATDHLVAVLDASASPPVPALLIRPTPFSPEAAVAAARVAEDRGWSLLLVPGLLAPPAVEALARRDIGLSELIAAGGGVDLRPTTDARPYFFALEPGMPRDARRAGSLALVVVAGLTAAAWWPRWRARHRHGAPPRRRGVADGGLRWLCAAALGAGFLAVELHALQVVQGALGHPAWSLALTLGSLLVGGAIGAGTAGRGAGVRRPAALAAGVVATWVAWGPTLARSLDGASPAAAGLVLAGALALVGMPMGRPFPRLLAAWRDPAGVAAAWAASGIAAVAAGAGALWLGHAIGASAVGWAAALAYAAAALLHPRLDPAALSEVDAGSDAQLRPPRVAAQASTSSSASGGL